MVKISWEKYSLVYADKYARGWILELHETLELEASTIHLYGLALDDYLLFCETHSINPYFVNKSQILQYVKHLKQRPNPRKARKLKTASASGLAIATMKRMLTSVRLFYDYLIDEQIRETNPVKRGRYDRSHSAHSERGILSGHSNDDTWIPTEEQWQAIIQAFVKEPLRNRAMLAIQYVGGLRREELVRLEIGDFDPAHCTIRIRSETTKNKLARTCVYEEETSELYGAYVQYRTSHFGRQKGGLFLSESPRNHGAPVSIWTWSKIVQRIAAQTGLEHKFTTHTMRHLRLTDLARAGWQLHEIASFAGHKDLKTTQKYIHLSGREVADKYVKTMQKIHQRRIQDLGKTLYD